MTTQNLPGFPGKLENLKDGICNPSIFSQCGVTDFSLLQELLSVSSVLGCQAQSQRDSECGLVVFTNGTACYCLLDGGTLQDDFDIF